MLAVVASVVTGPASYAVTSTSSSTTNDANTLKISPLRTDVEIAPGQSKAVPVYVTNITDAPITVSPIENDFVAGDEKGTPALILDASQHAPTHSLKQFMAPLSDVTIQPGKIATVNVLITVSKDAQAGGYFGAVRFAPSSATSGGQVNLNASAASLILLTVPGKLVQKLQLTDFEVQQKGKTGTFFTTPSDLSVFLRLENKGNVQAAPVGQINVQNGKKVVYTSNFNTQDPHDEILPDSARRWTIPAKDISNFGHYKVSATLSYGTTNESINVSTSFWVVPVWMMIAAGVALLVLIAIIVLIILAIRRRRNGPRLPRRGKVGFNK